MFNVQNFSRGGGGGVVRTPWIRLCLLSYQNISMGRGGGVFGPPGCYYLYMLYHIGMFWMVSQGLFPPWVFPWRHNNNACINTCLKFRIFQGEGGVVRTPWILSEYCNGGGGGGVRTPWLLLSLHVVSHWHVLNGVARTILFINWGNMLFEHPSGPSSHLEEINYSNRISYVNRILNWDVAVHFRSQLFRSTPFFIQKGGRMR